MLRIILLITVAFCIPIAAQNRAKAPTKSIAAPAKIITPVAENNYIEPETPNSLPTAELPAIAHRYEIFASFSHGKRLQGYTDPRYIADDKTDYLKSPAMTANLEFAVKIPYRVKANPGMSPLQDIFAGTEYLRIGGQMTGWSILNGSSVSIPKTGAPINAEAVNASLSSATRPGLGFFVGFGRRDLEVDLGMTVALSLENEGSRTRRVVDANGNVTGATEEVAGRGLFIANAFVLPTFRLAWGSRDDLQLVMSAGRETFEFQRDYLQT